MKKFNVTVTADIIVEFDENSEEFKKLWENYKKYFDPYATYETLADTVAYLIAKYGTTEFIEGWGYVKLNGRNQTFFCEGEYKEVSGLINVEVDTDINYMVDYEIDYTQDLSEKEE